jgi:hypothetical protein
MTDMDMLRRLLELEDRVQKSDARAYEAEAALARMEDALDFGTTCLGCADLLREGYNNYMTRETQLERAIIALAEKWVHERMEYPVETDPRAVGAAAAVKLCAEEMLSLLDRGVLDEAEH